jgi:hypothetical protein
MRSRFKDIEVDAVADGFIADGDLEVGDTVRFNHAPCMDARRRGYITRRHSDIDGGGVIELFYCHNCGAADARNSNGATIARYAALPPPSKTENVLLPPDSIRASAGTAYEVPTHIITWAHGYRVADYAMWSPSMGRIIMPVYSDDGDSVLGYQARRDPEGSVRIPKYITVSRSDKPMWMRVKPSSYSLVTPPLVVFVEDWVSAHQFRNMHNVMGVPLFGLNVTAEHVMWADRICSVEGIAPEYLVWLDNDVTEAHKASQYLCRLLGAMGRTVAVEAGAKEPKHTSTTELAHIIDSYYHEGTS